MENLPSIYPEKELIRIVEDVISAGLLPKEFNTPGKALAVARIAHDLGIPPMIAFNSLFPLPNGRIGTDTKTMEALVMRTGLLEDLRIEEETDAVTVYVKRKGINSPISFRWSDDDTRRAGLQSSSAHQKYPRQMRIWRALSAALRIAFPDVLMGLYAVEEFGISPTDINVSQPQVVEATFSEEINVTDWLSFSKAVIAKGSTVEEALFLLGVKDFTALMKKFPDPKQAFEKFLSARDERMVTKRAEQIIEVGASLGATITMEQAKAWLAENPDADPSSFPFEQFIGEESTG